MWPQLRSCWVWVSGVVTRGVRYWPVLQCPELTLRNHHDASAGHQCIMCRHTTSLACSALAKVGIISDTGHTCCGETLHQWNKLLMKYFNITNYFIEAILMLRCLRTPNDRCANVVTEYMIFSMRHVGLGLTLEHHDQLTLIQPHTHMVSGHETFLPGNITSWAEPCLAPPLSHHHQHLILISETVKF